MKTELLPHNQAELVTQPHELLWDAYNGDRLRRYHKKGRLGRFFIKIIDPNLPRFYQCILDQEANARLEAVQQTDIEEK